MSSQVNGSVIRAFQILDLFSDEVTEVNSALLAARLGLNAVTAHRFLKTLEQAGAIAPISRGTYRLSYKLADLGARASGTNNLRSAVQPVIDALTRDCGEGTLASVFDGERAVCFARALPDRPMFVGVHLGSRLEAYASAHGKLWLSRLGDAALDKYMSQVALEPLNETVSTNPTALLAELAEVRKTGIAFNNGEREADVHAIAVAVENRSREMICGLSVFGPAARMGPVMMERLKPMLQQAARNVQDALYGDGPHI